MFSIIYLDHQKNYVVMTGNHSSEISIGFDYLESQGYTVITIYDYKEQIQIYRCIDYDLHRYKMVNVGNGLKYWNS